MIRFDNVTIRYPGAAAPTLENLTLRVGEGELCLVVGPTGSGKSTLLRAVNGLVPYFTGGRLTGTVRVNGRDTASYRPRDLADVVGMVGQDPLATFVTDTVEDELAYSMESLGFPADTMRTRVEEILDLLGLAEVRDRPIVTLSGGQQQRVAIGSVLTVQPHVLVLDEPTSALDPGAAEDVLSALHRLVSDLGLTVLLAEHRLERVVQYADRIVFVPGNGTPVTNGAPEKVMEVSTIAPPVVELGRLAGWTPLPLSVRDARRRAPGLRDRLDPAAGAPGGETRLTSPDRRTAAQRPADAQVLGMVDGLRVRYDDAVAVADVRLAFRTGEITALMGRNGAGKSSLLKAMVGLVKRAGGSVRLASNPDRSQRQDRIRSGDLTVDPARADPPTIVRSAGLIPQHPADLLYARTVAEECRNADRDFAAPPGRCAAMLHRLAPDVPPDRHPRDLSEGQRLAVALAVILTGEPPLLLLDEPTRGLDYLAKQRLAAMLRELAADGRAVLFATHDVELVADLANRVVVLADGEVVADGATDQVVVASPMFAPQVAKILRPSRWLTVAEVARALHGIEEPR